MIGVAGCGRMGGPMLTALRRSGIDAVGYDVRTTGVDGCSTDANAFRTRIDTLITVVRDIAQTEDLLFGAQHLSDAPHLTRVILCSTLSPRYVRALPDRMPSHFTLIDAPMSGAQIAAENARLSFMLGGQDRDLDAAQHLFSAMGTSFHRMGTYGAGMQAKVLNNLLAASHVAMTRLVLDWSDQAGLDETSLRALVHASSGQNWFASGFDDIEFARDGFEENNTVAILVKDIQSALDAAPEGANLDLPKLIQKHISNLKPRAPVHLAN
jgi:3-hydroxyisobutyrate dehydrogenase-like beta-hydroxyacid dehydrogenase